MMTFGVRVKRLVSETEKKIGNPGPDFIAIPSLRPVHFGMKNYAHANT